jgi:hypothetical protein
MNAQELKLDYFKIYQVVEQEAGYRVALQGQFDEELEDAKLLYLEYFANPVSKNQEPFHDRNAHLAWYRIYQPKPDPLRRVVVENQFGRQGVIIGKPLALLAPALKREKRSQFPEGLDHYKVYWVLEGEPVGKDVTLQDQFGREETRIADPIAFGVPARKEHGDKVSRIRNDNAHLMIYRISPRSSPQAKVVRDQFRLRYLYFLCSVRLAVPSVKLEWEEL